MLRLAHIISIILHPLLMPLYATFLLFNSGSYLAFATGDGMQYFIYMIVFISTAVIPALISYLLLKNGTINSLQMEERRERIIPFIVTLICYVFGIYFLFKLPVPRLFGFILSGAAVAVLWGFLVNFRWKISIHMIGIGGLTGLIYAYAYYFHGQVLIPLIIIAVLSGILGTARLISKSHIPSQVYLGFAGGFFIEFFFIRALFTLAANH